MNGNWGVWGEWGTCQAECGDGVRIRTRLCNDPTPSAEGRNCPIVNGTAGREEEACNEGECKGGRTSGCFLVPPTAGGTDSVLQILNNSSLISFDLPHLFG